jgi:hypothetical protein
VQFIGGVDMEQLDSGDRSARLKFLDIQVCARVCVGAMSPRPSKALRRCGGTCQARREIALWDGFLNREEAMLHTMAEAIVVQAPVVVSPYDLLLFPVSMQAVAWCVTRHSCSPVLLATAVAAGGRLTRLPPSHSRCPSPSVCAALPLRHT